MADDSDSKFRAKRTNEHVKSVYSAVNTIAAFVIGTGFIAPIITKGSERVDIDARGWVAVGFFIHLFGHFVIRRYMRPEE